MSKTVIVIPARYGSSRLPGKPLLDIIGKPMIQHVYERALQVPDIDEVWVATDDERVKNAVEAFNGKVVMTRSDHESGTDRLVEVMEQVDADIYINLQGDEPLIRPADVARLAEGMRADAELPVATLCHSISASEALEPSCVKVVLNTRQDALYFSRSPIPYPRNEDKVRYLKHVGIYAYRKSVLQGYSQLPEAMPEQAESLEQLRLMNAGVGIRAFQVEPTGPGVDTPACLEKVRALMAEEVV
ncbi:3-deoxy-manno-octulosonate cytidylyltransferase [Pantoea sp. A4]|uniref:3-deoxy-manno-octulosonate cytidylyltransferase n=1 Tax=Pantoea sp. A4 TaxID=1225184 RepID=UPI0003668E63|nr:3-deoxy-manno-octulosonate cytidylyltransferase [Pantoea sp. A4]